MCSITSLYLTRRRLTGVSSNSTGTSSIKEDSATGCGRRVLFVARSPPCRMFLACSLINPYRLYCSSQPFVIWKSLESLSDGDLLAYVDTGCSFNTLGRPRLLEYFNVTSFLPNGLLAFQLNQQEQMWTKRDTSFFLGCNAAWCFEEKQVMATVSFWKNTAKNRKFARHWYEYGFSHNYTLITDSLSMLPNHSTFKEHRHDQSIFSIMCRQRMHKDSDVRLIPDETWFSSFDTPAALDSPIWATRLKF